MDTSGLGKLRVGDSKRRRPPPKPNISTNPLTCFLTYIIACLSTSLPTPREADRRPWVDIKVENVKTKALIDSGSEMTCISEDCFNLIKWRHKLQVVPMSRNLRLSSASGQEMKLIGRFLVNIDMLGRSILRPFYVVQGLKNHAVVLGIDFIREQQLVLDGGDAFFKAMQPEDIQALLVLSPAYDQVLEPKVVQQVKIRPKTVHNEMVPPGCNLLAYTAKSNVGMWDSMSTVDENGYIT